MLHADVQSLPVEAQPSVLLAPTSLQARVAAFFPLTTRFKEPYGWVVPNYQLEASHRFDFSDAFEFWVNLNWTPWEGRRMSCGFSDLNLLNLYLGASGFYRPNRIIYIYGGYAITPGWVWVTDHLTCCSSCSPHQKTYHDSAFCLGALTRVGMQINLGAHIFLDFSIEGLYEVAFFHQGMGIGGVKTVGGLGGRF
jgi:hypothetical protein